jgi:hypothetical protein
MLRRFSLLLALLAGACADNPYRTSNRQEVKGEGMSVVITGARTEAEGRPLADDYCRTHGGGAAEFKGMVQYRALRTISKVASFECRPAA